MRDWWAFFCAGWADEIPPQFYFGLVFVQQYLSIASSIAMRWKSILILCVRMDCTVHVRFCCGYEGSAASLCCRHELVRKGRHPFYIPRHHCTVSFSGCGGERRVRAYSLRPFVLSSLFLLMPSRILEHILYSSTVLYCTVSSCFFLISFLVFVI